MELVERYLQAVSFWLPKQQKHDIIAELSEDIRAQIEEREAELGRKLQEGEVEGILRERGRPVLVANRFLPQEHLIGPALFPIYRFFLKLAALGFLAPALLVRIGLMVFSPAFRVEHSWMGALGFLWSQGFTILAVVTVVFALLDRVQAKTRFLEKWNPRQLPPIRYRNLIPRSGSTIELAVSIAVAIWWAAHLSSTTLWLGPDVQVTVSPSWTYFYWAWLLLLIANVALAARNLARPYWTETRAALRLVLNAAGSIIFCLLLNADIVAGIAVTNVSSDRASEITNTINLWMQRAAPVAVVAGVVIASCDVFRIVRLKMKCEQPAREATSH